jgi:hypothetical protein
MATVLNEAASPTRAERHQARCHCEEARVYQREAQSLQRTARGYHALGGDEQHAERGEQVADDPAKHQTRWAPAIDEWAGEQCERDRGEIRGADLDADVHWRGAQVAKIKR